jgi:hypothetical protein
VGRGFGLRALRATTSLNTRARPTGSSRKRRAVLPFGGARAPGLDAPPGDSEKKPNNLLDAGPGGDIVASGREGFLQARALDSSIRPLRRLSGNAEPER